MLQVFWLAWTQMSQEELLFRENINNHMYAAVFFSLKWHKLWVLRWFKKAVKTPASHGLIGTLLVRPHSWLSCAVLFHMCVLFVLLPPGTFRCAVPQLCLSLCSLPRIKDAKTILCCWQNALEHFPNSCYRLVVVFSPCVLKCFGWFICLPC